MINILITNINESLTVTVILTQKVEIPSTPSSLSVWGLSNNHCVTKLFIHYVFSTRSRPFSRPKIKKVFL